MKLKLFLATLLITNFSLVINAQFDDLYYDPNKDAALSTSSSGQYTDNSNATSSDFDDQSYDYYDEIDDNDYYNSDYDDYQYSTRMRRFGRPSACITYYSPIWGFGWRDPYYNPYYDNYFYGNNAAVVVIGNSWGWNRWNRWNSWNNYGWNNWGWNNNYCGYNDWGWNNGWGNGWGNNYCVNNYYGYNNHHGNWNNGGWNNGGWNNGNNGNNNGGNNNGHGTYYGSRKSGSSIASTKGRIEGPRKQTTNTNPQIRPDGLVIDDGNTTTSNTSPRRGDKSRSNSNEIDKTTERPERSSIYNRKRTDVSDRSEKYRSDYSPTPKRNGAQESDRTADQSSRQRNQTSESPRSSRREERSNESSRSNQSSGRNYDSGNSSRSSGSSSSGSSGRSSGGSSGGGGGRSSQRGGGK